MADQIPIYKPREYSEYFFTLVDASENQYKCKYGCKKTIKQNKKNGYSNLMAHLKSHKTYAEDFYLANKSSGAVLTSFINIDNKSKSIFRWLNLVVNCSIPINKTEDKDFCEAIKEGSISKTTLRKYLRLVYEEVVSHVAKILPDKFGIIFDGWTHANDHYIALFAVFEGKGSVREEIILACYPILDEHTDLTAASHKEYIASVLSDFSRSWDNVLFLVGDNCSTNHRLSDICSKPIIGCASHRLNLAVKFLINEEKWTSLIDKVHLWMKRLNSIKNRRKLKNYTKLKPVLLNQTRWSSTFEMLKRFEDLKEYIPFFENETEIDFDIQSKRIISQMLVKMKKIESVTKTLQSSEITLAQVRLLFDKLNTLYPVMKKYLEPDSKIVKNFLFESSICKVLNDQENNLTNEEINCLLPFKKVLSDESNLGVSSPSDTSESNWAKEILNADRKTKEAEQSSFINLSFIPPTSCTVERLFSQAKIILSERRYNMNPNTFNQIMFLRRNRAFWNAALVAKIRNQNAYINDDQNTVSNHDLDLSDLE